MSFFSMFPYRSFDLQNNGINRVITDIFRNVDVNESLIESITAYRSYHINDGERPDIVSNKLYNNPDYYWTFFITNDFLKEGMLNWPMSNLEFEKFIQDEYGKYSVMTFVPLVIPNQTYTISGSLDPDEEKIPYTLYYNTFTTLPIQEPYLSYLHLSAYNSEVSPIASSKIIRYDPATLQLWIEKKNNDAFYNVSSNVSRYDLQFLNPYSEQDEQYAEIEQLRIEWNEKVLLSLKITDPKKYYEYESARIDNPENVIYPVSSFIPSNIWQDSYNAAFNFYKQEDDDSTRIISYYDLMLNQIATLDGQYNITTLKNTNTDYISYIQNEYNTNESHRNISVIQPEYVSLFEESFKNILNSNV
jgi:hypothetical protein